MDNELRSLKIENCDIIVVKTRTSVVAKDVWGQRELSFFRLKVVEVDLYTLHLLCAKFEFMVRVSKA